MNEYKEMENDTINGEAIVGDLSICIILPKESLSEWQLKKKDSLDVKASIDGDKIIIQKDWRKKPSR